jgi:integrase
MKHLLTDTVVRHAKPEPDGRTRRLWDGGGLYLQVTATGGRLWRYKYRLNSKENVFALGAYPEIGLAKARALHGDARALVAKGIAPRNQREADKLKSITLAADTFRAVAEEWIAKMKGTWSDSYRRQVETSLASDVYPAFGSLPIRQVSAQHILAVMKAVEARGAEHIAILIRQWCSQIYRYAASNLRADIDPAAALRGAVVRPKVKHNKALSSDELRKLIAALQGYGGLRQTSIAIELLLLTFVRTVELRCATWDEIDLGKGLWTIPEERMKMKRPHVVPLSTQAMALLKELKKFSGGKGWLFANSRRPESCMTPTTINRALERMGFSGAGTLGFSAHGFRGTASTHLHEMGLKPEWIEMQLAHAQRNKSAAAYNKAQYLKERVAMLQQWADHVDSLRPEKKV